MSGGCSRLTNKPFSTDDLKWRVQHAGQRRTRGCVTQRAFAGPGVVEELKARGFMLGSDTTVIVSWGLEEDGPTAAGVQLWDFKDILKEIAQIGQSDRPDVADDAIRTLQLMVKATRS